MAKKPKKLYHVTLTHNNSRHEADTWAVSEKQAINNVRFSLGIARYLWPDLVAKCEVLS